MKYIRFRPEKQNNFYHFIARTGYPLVQLRFWPIVASVGLGGAAFSTIKFLHGGSFFWV